MFAGAGAGAATSRRLRLQLKKGGSGSATLLNLLFQLGPSFGPEIAFFSCVFHYLQLIVLISKLPLFWWSGSLNVPELTLAKKFDSKLEMADRPEFESRPKAD